MGSGGVYRKAAEQLAVKILEKGFATEHDIEQLALEFAAMYDQQLAQNDPQWGKRYSMFKEAIFVGNVFSYHHVSGKVTFQSTVMKHYWERELNWKPAA
jgi:hypothetical protein